tara:strand:- start:33 stop:383 length:351 start_codon:yes stop_codon:yes gene_type:complete
MKNFKTVEELNIEVSRINLTQTLQFDLNTGHPVDVEIFAKVNCINLGDKGVFKDLINPNDIELFITQIIGKDRIPLNRGVGIGKPLFKLAIDWVMMQLKSINIQHNDSSRDVTITH